MGKNNSLMFQWPWNGCLQALLAFCSDESVSSKASLDLSINQVMNALNSPLNPPSCLYRNSTPS
ncbi:hypothetical protein L195_g041650 [Trifolium pratense]|uniref:Uncharacterized protein n=1 Tax=Trifolium pratense TaxID=57577 RepID=A0A2K3M471_TRIPR|nr:hypothetical protein L195_g041650 [Trifolium pratense]